MAVVELINCALSELITKAGETRVEGDAVRYPDEVRDASSEQGNQEGG